MAMSGSPSAFLGRRNREAARAESSFELRILGLPPPETSSPIGHYASATYHSKAPEERLEVRFGRGGAPATRALRTQLRRGRAQPRLSARKTSCSTAVNTPLGARTRRMKPRFVAGGRRHLSRSSDHALGVFLPTRESYQPVDFAAPDVGDQVQRECESTAIAFRTDALTEMSFSNSAFSSCVRKPYSARTSSRTCV